MRSREWCSLMWAVEREVEIGPRVKIINWMIQESRPSNDGLGWQSKGAQVTRQCQRLL